MAVDSYKIVAVLKKRGSSSSLDYSYVPHKWEENGILYWPNNNLTSLRNDASTKPQIDWKQYKCKVKKSQIFGLEEAQLWEEEYVASGTDAEGSGIGSKISFNSSVNNISRSTTKYDDLFDQTPGVTLESDHLSVSHEVTDETEIRQSNVQHNTTTTNADISLLNLDLALDPEVKNKINKILENQEIIINIQKNILEKMHAEFLKQTTINDFICQKLNNLKLTSLDSVEVPTLDVDFQNKFDFPLNSVDEILQFEKEVTKDPEYRNFMEKKLCNIRGVAGDEDGKMVAKKILTMLFNKNVLSDFSWTGISRTKGVERKVAFQSCEAIQNITLKVISMADSRWTQQKNEKYLKSVTKHAKHEGEKKIKLDAQANPDVQINQPDDQENPYHTTENFTTTVDSSDNPIKENTDSISNEKKPDVVVVS